jgi:hypothetical protein
MIPDTTHLQFLILDLLMSAGEMPGRDLRSKLAAEGQSKSGPAFYQLMARLEDLKYVTGWYVEKMIDGQRIKERRYRIAAAGERARDEVLRFYSEHATGFEGGLAHA